jgi:SHS2 domain-containing protein
VGEYRVVEHTADVGIYASGTSLADLFTQATLGMLEITGTWRPGPSSEHIALEVSSHDLGGLLVDWLSEVLYVQDARDVVITEVEVDEIEGPAATGRVGISSHGEDDIEGTPVKAITYHQLEVEQTEDGWMGHVFFDI